MPGPQTNNLQPHLSGASCAGQQVEKLRRFDQSDCLTVAVAEGKVAVVTGINLGVSVVTLERVSRDECDAPFYTPYSAADCPFEVTAARPIQPIKLPGEYRLCINPPNEDARLGVDYIDSTSDACCELKQRCGPCVDSSWDATGVTRCVNGVGEAQEQSNCGAKRWAPYAAANCFCASGGLPGGGFIFVPGDTKDPAATVDLASCDGTIIGSIYPAPGPGHTVPVSGCDGAVVGYAGNNSPCGAPLGGC